MKSKSYFTQSEAEEIMALISEKLKSDSQSQKGIRTKIRNRGFWASEYGIGNGYTVADFLRVAKIVGSKTASGHEHETKERKSFKPAIEITKSQSNRSQSDESYIIDLCDEVLNLKALRQHRFDFLRGDAGTRLPVDAYYPSLNLVVEFKEKQHTEEVKFFDKRITASGKTRGEQRKLYDKRRRDVLPTQGIKLIELDYSDFEHTRGKKLVRNKEVDLKVIKDKLKS